ncbi:MAG: ABC transporter ATP-binding protein, partial [Syntrophomonadaceae bacterium]|nr:ABC transporter ATP-binding protein [Syntrophomonadaceae bacterium]
MKNESREIPQKGGHMGVPRGGPMGPMNRPVDKARNFKGTFKRLLGYLKPWGLRLLIVLLFAILSTVFSIFSPRVMGMATTSLFEDLMQKYNQVPGAAVDFAYI